MAVPTAAPRASTIPGTSSPSPPAPPRAAHLSSHQARQSRFLEMESNTTNAHHPRTPTPPTSMDEFSPASLSTESATESDTELEDDDHAPMKGWRVVLRVLNGCTHGVACVLLVAIMAGFLRDMGGTWYRIMSPQAITLTVLLGLDIILDMCALAQIRKRWPGWAVLLRLTCGIGYLVVFMVYVGLGRVFPYLYIYWGIEASYAGPVVYLFLWLIGVWNLLHTALHRHALGHSARVCASTLRSRRRSSRRAGGNHHAGASRWRRWTSRRSASGTGQPRVDVERQRGGTSLRERNNTHDISLAERNDEENKAASLSTTLSRPRTDDTVIDTGQHMAGPGARTGDDI